MSKALFTTDPYIWGQHRDKHGSLSPSTHPAALEERQQAIEWMAMMRDELGSNEEYRGVDRSIAGTFDRELRLFWKDTALEFKS